MVNKRWLLRFFLLLSMIFSFSLVALADNCSGGSDCTVVPANNTGANAMAAFAASATLAALVYNSRTSERREEEINTSEEEKEEEREEENDISLNDFFLGETPLAEGTDSTTRHLPIDEPLGTDPPANDSTSRSLPIDDPLGTDPPVNDPTSR